MAINFVWIGEPFEGFGMGVVIVEEAIDRGLEVGGGSEDSAFEAGFGEGCEETLNGVEPGGRGRREVEGPSRVARQPLAHDGMLMSSVIVEDGVEVLPAGTSRSIALRKRMNSWCRWRCILRPITVPSRTFTAANKVVVPCRL